MNKNEQKRTKTNKNEIIHTKLNRVFAVKGRCNNMGIIQESKHLREEKNKRESGKRERSECEMR
jgi:hypothetical protein